MTDKWNSNLASLKKSNPELSAVVGKIGFKETDRYQILKSPNGDHFLEDGHIVITSLSKEKLKKKFGKIPYPKIILVCGISSPSFLKDLLESEEGKRASYILIIDNSLERFSWFLNQSGVDSFISDPRLTFFIEENLDSLFNTFFNWLRIPERAFKMSADQVVMGENLPVTTKEFFESAVDEWQAAKKQIQRHFGEKEDSLLGLKYSVENFPLIASSPGISDFKGKFKGIPAVIASTGPSLQRSLKHLQTIQDRCLILAADASLNILLENGITPHLAATLERDLFSKKFFEKSSMQNGRLKTHLVSYPFVPGEGLRTYKGPLMFAYRDYGYFRFFNEVVERGIISSSSSVAHFCFNLAQYLECSEVVLIGQDLAYDPETFASHSKGIVYSEWGESSDLNAMKERARQEGLGEVFFVPGNKVDKVPTHSTYFSFMKEFSWEASRSNIHVTNCTDGGAKIPSIDWKDFGEATREWKKEFDCLKILENSGKNKSDNFKSLTPILGFLSELKTKLSEILTLTSNPTLFSALPENKKTEIIQSLRLAQTELMKDIRFVSFIVQNCGRDFLRIENDWSLREATNNWSFIDALQSLRSWTELTHEVTSKVEGLISAAVQD